ncbi:cyclophilin-like fold protein [uncultured Parasutterella sp.]|uniref:cyclophilin-like fold protein n=1 Tax=uncultured Parasutterella sp. TaxID=1263098 RepID=UPI0025D866D2|nr:cyclophilin-like fold protein [uncultured Parasutterella sp.]
MKFLTAAAITACLFLSGNVMAQNIQIKVGDKAYTCELNGNDAAKDFASKLPLKLKFEDFGSTERISYLPKALNLGSAPRSYDPQKGDLTYYIPWGNLAVFVRDFRPSDNLVPLGKLSPEALKAIQESGSKDVEISLVK